MKFLVRSLELQCTVPLGPIETRAQVLPHFGSRTLQMLQCTVPLGPIETLDAPSNALHARCSVAKYGPVGTD